MIGYVFDDALGGATTAALERFLDVSAKAKEILASSDAEWQRIAPLIGTDEAGDAEDISRALSRRHSAPARSHEEEADARTLYRVLARARRVGAGRTGEGTRSPGTYYRAATGANLDDVRLASLALFVAAWFDRLCSLAGERMLPGSAPCSNAILTEARVGRAASMHLGVTLARVLMAFTLAMAIGTAIGLLMGRSRLADRLGDSWLLVLLNLPALVVIVLAYIWGGLTEAAAIRQSRSTSCRTRQSSRCAKARARSIRRSTKWRGCSRMPRWKAFRHVVHAAARALSGGGAALRPVAGVEDRSGRGIAGPAEWRRLRDRHRVPAI